VYNLRVKFNLFLFVLCFVTIGCSSEEECTPSDWVGVYSLDKTTEVCSSSNVSLNEQITITLGSNTTSVDLEGTILELDGCETATTNNLFGISATLDEDKIALSFLGCTGTYIRQ